VDKRSEGKNDIVLCTCSVASKKATASDKVTDIISILEKIINCKSQKLKCMTSQFIELTPIIISLKSSRAINRINVELKTNVSEISSVSIFRVDVVNDRMSLIFIPVFKLMPLPIGVLCSRRAESNCTVTHPTLTMPRVA
jgi:hypothetical protein